MGYIPILSLFILSQTVPSLPLGVSSGWLLCCFDMSHPFWNFPYVLALQVVTGSSGIFPALALELTTSPKHPSSLDWGMVFRNQDPGPRDAHGYMVPVLLCPVSEHSWEVQVCTQILPHVYLFIYVCTCLYVSTIHPTIHPFKTMSSY